MSIKALFDLVNIPIYKALHLLCLMLYFTARRGVTMKFGFIGCGNMGGAIARAVCAAVGGENVILANKTRLKAELLAGELGCSVGDNREAAACDFVFLGVKPQMMADMLRDIKPALEENPNVVLVSMAAGLTTHRIREMAGGNYQVIRIMPNTPVAIGKGMIQYCSLDVDGAAIEVFLRVMAPAGHLDGIGEHLMDAASAVSGCGPAFACIFLEALADGGVSCGLPRAKAMEYAAQMLLGAASMVLDSGKHPGELKDAVCSPGGSTIRGVLALEENSFRSAAASAVIAAYEKNIGLSKL